MLKNASVNRVFSLSDFLPTPSMVKNLAFSSERMANDDKSADEIYKSIRRSRDRERYHNMTVEQRREKAAKCVYCKCCGKHVRTSNKTNHKKTKIHQKNLARKGISPEDAFVKIKNPTIDAEEAFSLETFKKMGKTLDPTVKKIILLGENGIQTLDVD